MEWCTPPEIINDVRSVLGVIDLDPASSAYANRWIMATKYYTKEENGLLFPWKGRVFLNPPYSRGLINQFAEKFATECDKGNVLEAVVITNSATEREWWRLFASRAHALCFPSKRIQFVTNEHKESTNTLPQTIFYFGPYPSFFAHIFYYYGTLWEHYTG